MKIYTRSGDEGITQMMDGQVEKHDLRVEVCGTIDELNAFIGQAISCLDATDLKQVLAKIQHVLFDLGTDIAQPDKQPYTVNATKTTQLEAWIDQFDAECPELKRFILPGGSAVSASLHICRVICRRAERRMVALSKAQATNPEICRYLNRLSDLFFVLARTVNIRAKVPEVEYHPEK